MIVTQWCAPAILCTLFVVPLRKNPLVRTCLIGGGVTITLALLGWGFHSAALARFPLPGLIYLHIAIGLLLHQSGILQPRTWPTKFRALLSPVAEISSTVMLQATVLILLAYFLLPQIASVFTGAHLARHYVARLLHRPDRQQHDREQLIDLLQTVGDRDVVLSDLESSWMIPSEHGRIVAAVHYELFVPDQPQRTNDLATFFATQSEAERARIIKKYDVKWIVLDRDKLDDSTLSARPAAPRRGNTRSPPILTYARRAMARRGGAAYAPDYDGCI